MPPRPIDRFMLLLALSVHSLSLHRYQQNVFLFEAVGYGTRRGSVLVII